MRERKLLTLAATLGLLALIGCRGPAALRAAVQEDPAYVTQVGMWAERGYMVWGTNYRVGTHIPVNTEVRVNEVARDLIGFSSPLFGGSTVKLVNQNRHTRLSIGALFDRTFARAPVDLSAAEPEVRDAIEQGEVLPGMTRRQVLASRGYPPHSMTPRLDADEWLYMRTKKSRGIVRFGQDDRVSEVLPKKPDPATAEVPVAPVVPVPPDPPRAPRAARVRGISAEVKAAIAEDPRFVTQVSMWIDRGSRVIATNYLGRVQIPVNTAVVITHMDRRRISFICPELDGRRVRLINSSYTRVGVEELFERTFGRTPVDLSGSEPKIRDAVERGDVRNGMTRGEVLTARGYPPQHRTPDLAGDQWVFWRSRFRKTVVRFGEDGRVTEIIPKPEDPEDPGDPGDAEDEENGEPGVDAAAPENAREK